MVNCINNIMLSWSTALMSASYSDGRRLSCTFCVPLPYHALSMGTISHLQNVMLVLPCGVYTVGIQTPINRQQGAF